MTLLAFRSALGMGGAAWSDADTWTGTNGAAWAAGWTTTGTADIQSNQGRLLTPATAYGAGAQAYRSGMSAVLDSELLFSFTTPATLAAETLYFGAGLRTDGTFTGFAPNKGYWLEFSPSTVPQDSYVALLRATGVAQGQVVALAPFTWAASTTYRARFRIVGTTLRAKVWPAAGSEPDTWTIVARDATNWYAGKLSFTSSSGNLATARDIRLDDYTMTPAGESVYPTGTAMQHWRAALQAGDATALFIGDSLTEGQGASAKANRWLDLLQPLVRSDAGLGTGGVGYLPAWYATYGPDSPWEPWTSRAGTHTDDPGAYSLGRRADQMAAGATTTYTVTGTSIDVWYVAGTGSFTVTVDGTAVRTVNTILGAPATSQRVAGISLGAAGSHSVVITAVQACKFAGLTVYNGDATTGARFIDAAKVGANVGDFAGMFNAWDLATPDLVVIELGVNDYLNAIATSAQVKSELKRQIADVRGAVSKPISVAVVLPPITGSPTPPQTENWTAYRQAIIDVTAEDTSVQLIDWEPIGFSGVNYATDGLHYSDAGHTAVAGLMRTALAASSAVTVTPDLASSTAAALPPTVAATVSVVPGLATATSTTYAPTLSAATTVSPGVASSSASALSPTAGGTVTVVPDIAASSSTAFAPAVTTPVTVTPGVAGAAPTLYAPTLSGQVAVTPEPATSTATTYAPTLNASATITPDAAGAAPTVYPPVVTVQGGPTTAVPDLAGSTPTVHQPALGGSVTVGPGMAVATAATFAPAVAGTVIVNPDGAATIATAYGPVVVPTVTIGPGTASSSPGTFPPDITAGPPPGAARDITLSIGPGRSRTLTATAAASRELAVVGRSRTLTTNPRE